MKKLVVLVVAVVFVSIFVPAQSVDAQEKIKVKDGCGTIRARVNNTVAVRLDDTGKIRVFKNVSPHIRFHFDNGEGSVYDLEPGMHACAYHYETVAPPELILIEEHQVATLVDEPDEHDAPPRAAAPPAPAAAPAAKPAPPAALPHTASSLPAAGLAGLLLIALSIGIGVLRRI
jgi:hypothetical protein